MFKQSLLLVGLLLVVSGCAEKTMPEEWCEEMMLKPNKEWQGDDFDLFAKSCIPEYEK